MESKIDCKECRNMLFDYMEKLMNGHQARIVQQHLEGCICCRQYLMDLEKAVHYLRQLKNEFLLNDTLPNRNTGNKQ